MYLCENCNKTIAPNTPSYLYPTVTRHKTYPKRIKVNRLTYVDDRKMYPDDPGGIGHETVKEIRCCKHCYEELNE